MKWPIAAAALILLGAQLSDAATAGSGDRVVKVAETQHFIFLAARKGDHTLKVDPRASERVLGDLSRTLGVTVPGKTTYVRLEYPEEVAFLAGFPSLWSSGVADVRSRTIHSTLPCHPHEIVHIVSAQLGQPGAFFSEGLAVALGDKGRIQGRDVDALARHYLRRVPVQSVIAAFHDVDAFAAYSIAGSFMRHLVRERGVALVARFFRNTRNANAPEAFRATFGEPLGSAIAEWQASL